MVVKDDHCMNVWVVFSAFLQTRILFVEVEGLRLIDGFMQLSNSPIYFLGRGVVKAEQCKSTGTFKRLVSFIFRGSECGLRFSEQVAWFAGLPCPRETACNCGREVSRRVFAKVRQHNRWQAQRHRGEKLKSVACQRSYGNFTHGL